jgi:hypothetical protein
VLVKKWNIEKITKKEQRPRSERTMKKDRVTKNPCFSGFLKGSLHIQAGVSWCYRQ